MTCGCEDVVLFFFAILLVRFTVLYCNCMYADGHAIMEIGVSTQTNKHRRFSGNLLL